MRENIRVAIDGPSGAGKSTLARSVAARLNFLYVDTGAIYRTIGYAVWRKGIDPRDRSAVVAVLPDLEICLTYGTDGLQHMELNGMDVTAEIRLPEVSRYASLVSAYPEIKVFLTASAQERARRRMLELEERGTPEPYAAILRAIQERDWNDTHRDAAPLRQAEDAVLLDTTALDFVQSEDALLHIIRERTGL